jgi:hypothetical protein
VFAGLATVVDLLFQNAMSPAEITQQLGLQSLTRRAWVSLFFFKLYSSLSSSMLTRLVHPIHLRHHG